MSKPEESGIDESSSFTEEQVRLYLLCLLGEGQRLKFEERLLADGDLAQRTRLAELELSDDYVAGRLSIAERDSFERKFLVSEGRRSDLRVSNALHEPAAASVYAIQDNEASWLQNLLDLFSFERHPLFATLGSLTLMILVAGVVWFSVRQIRKDEPLIAGHEAAPTPQANVSPANHSTPIKSAPSPQPSPDRKPVTMPTPAEPQTPPTVATLILSPGSLRGSGDLARVAVPSGKRDVVRLMLVPEADGHGIYRAQLLTVEGKALLARERLQIVTDNSGSRLVLNIPAQSLKAGDYQIRLSRQLDGKTEVIGSYYFRAVQN
jgi:hypothetical protein